MGDNAKWAVAITLAVGAFIGAMCARREPGIPPQQVRYGDEVLILRGFYQGQVVKVMGYEAYSNGPKYRVQFPDNKGGWREIPAKDVLIMNRFEKAEHGD